MIEETEIARYRCIGDDGALLTIVELQRFARVISAAGTRRQPGTRWLSLSSGETVRYIDCRTFEVVTTGELVSRVD